ncbi:MAG: EamA family transporter, partial [Terriglobales bacterium]
TRAIVTSCLEPVFAILIAMLFVGETLQWTQALGVVIVLAATIVVQLPERRTAGSAVAGRKGR